MWKVNSGEWGGMIRRLFTSASVASLLICVTVIVLWVRSYSHCDSVGLERVEVLPNGQRRQVLRAVNTCPSVIYFVWSSFPGSAPLAGVRREKSHANFLGFEARNLSQPIWRNATWDSGVVRQYFRWKFLRIAWWSTGRLALPGGGWQDHRAIVVPDWLLVSVLLILPILRVRRFGFDRQRFRRELGQCTGCGYDLRASTDRCPECGAPITAEAKA